MKKIYQIAFLHNLKSYLSLWICLFCLAPFGQAQISFNASNLQGENLGNPTSLQFGPDERLYVSQQNGTIYVFTVERDNAAPGNGAYSVISTEVINLVKNDVPNHNDDGALNSNDQRQVTGLLVAGTATNPILYVTSSDWRIAVGNDSGLDTNSGVISELTCPGGIANGECQGGWVKVDLVRGLPRCEENHAINGLDLDETNNMLFVQMGGHTNKGAPGNNFSGTPEYFFSGAMIRVDLDQLDGMPVYTDPRTATQYKYDLPTLDDPTRANIDNTSPDFPYPAGHPLYDATIDIGDPFGGNNSLNQAFPEPGGPVQIFAPGFRNAYDVVVTENGRIYTSDNGPNGGWGGLPFIYDAGGNVKAGGNQNTATYNSTLDINAGDYITNEFSDIGSDGHGDPLHFVGNVTDADNTYYGGHPAPIRAFPELSGIIVYEEQGNGNWVQVGPTYQLSNLIQGVQGYFNSSFTILDDFPDNPIEATYSANVGVIDIINASTNGICEYTGSNFGGAMQGNILTASFNNNIYRYGLNAAGDAYDEKEALFSNFGNNPLDVTAQGDDEIFPGTIWVATHGANNVTVFEPSDFGNCPQPGDPDYVGTDDSDQDGYSNDDEIDNGTNHCSGGSVPSDNDGDFVSDLNDPDDDNDGILDINDAFAIDADNGTTTTLPVLYPFWNFDPGTGFFGVGFTGLMTNFSTDYLDQFDESLLSFGGAAGKAGVESVTAGDAYQNNNNQDNAFQFGVDVDANSGPFTVHSRLEAPFFAVNGTASTPVNFQSFGIFIGTGDQDNYLKVVFNANGGDGGIQVLLEDNTATSEVTYGSNVTGDLLNAGSVDLYISVDPGAETAQPYVSIDDGGTITPLGGSLDLPAGWLDPNDNQGLAVGIISTSFGSGIPFDATWDFLNVTEDNPGQLTALVDPLNFGELIVNTDPSTLNIPVRNDGGPADGSIEITSVAISGPDQAMFSTNNPNFQVPVGSVVDDGIDITFTPGNTTGIMTAVAEITHTGTNSPLIVQLQAEVTNPPVPLYRVNAGGPTIAAVDGGIDWVSDNNVTLADDGFEVNTGNTSDFTGGSWDETADPSIQSTTPFGIFNTERWDPNTGAEMQYNFDMGAPGTYEVRLFLMNGFSGTSNPGERIFDVEIEGQSFANLAGIDLSGDFGHQEATVIVNTVTITDNILTIDFIHNVENPLVNGIEILGNAGSLPNPIVVDAVPNQSNDEGDLVSLQVNASGGDGALSYSAANLPAGLSVNTSTGEISGTIAAGAASNSPYTVTVTVDDSDGDAGDAQTESFSWTVSEPGVVTPGEVLYRINNGGVEIPSHDASAVNWSPDQSPDNAGGTASTGPPSPYVTTDSDNTFGGNVPNLVNTTGYPDDIFKTERWDDTPEPEMQWDFPVDNGDYTVNLLFAEIWTGAQNPGVRIFDVLIEGALAFDDYDITDDVGFETAVVKTFNTTVTDGNLDIDFQRVAQNPAIKGIEIIAAAPAGAPSVLNAEVITEVIDGNNGVDVTVATTGLNLPGGLLDPATVNTATVKLFEDATNTEVTTTFANTVTGDDNIVLTAQDLDFGTTYRLEITDGVEDVNANAMTPFTGFTFTTDAGGANMDLSGVEFEQLEANARSENYTTVTVGPDGKLYALTAEGLIVRFDINTDGTLANPQDLNSLQTAEGGDRLALGLTFDPAATANNLIAWVTHSDYNLSGGSAAPWSGKLTQLSGANLENVQDYVTGLPRAAITHATNSMIFGSDGAMYLSQGHTSAAGAPGASGYGSQPEQLLSAAILKIDIGAISPPLDVQTADGGSYDPSAPGAPVTLFATGLRNAYDIVWHSNGQLYAPTNGAEAGQPLPDLPGANSLTLNNEPFDYLNRVEAGGYYGHPSPVRGELVLNGGNPTAGPDPAEVNEYPVGTLPDPNWQGYAFQFGGSESPNGIIEYQSNIFGGALQGKLMIVRYNQGFDIVILTPGGDDFDIVGTQQQVPGFSGLFSALDLTENTANGHLYVAPFGGSIQLIRPLLPAGNPAAFVEVNANAGLGASTFNANSFQITNTGDVDINTVTFDISTTFMPDIVFDPVGTAGDPGGKCLAADSGAGATGFTTPGDPCTDPFSQFHNGTDSDDGYDVLNLDFTDFNNGETFGFSVDIDPTSIKMDNTAGDAGSISGFELIGATVTIEFANGQTLSAPLWDEGSLGGAQAVVAPNAPAPAPTLSVSGVSPVPATVNNASQTVLLTGPANADFTLLQVDARLYIDAGGGGYDIDPFEANEAMAKVLYTGTFDGSGQASVPVTLLQTASSNAGPDGGLNHFLAVVDGQNGQISDASNVVVLEYDPNATPVEGIYINAGGPEYTDGQGQTWIADQYFTTPSQTFTSPESIDNTTDDVLFQSERYGGNFSYNVPVDNGTYTVELYLAEIYHGAPGSGSGNGAGDRIFSVDIETANVLSDYDLFATADAANGAPADNGALYALIESFENIQVSDGTLNLDFYLGPNGVDNAKIAAICIKPQETATDAGLTVEVELQGRTDFSGDYDIELYDPADNSTPLYTFQETAGANGQMTVAGIAPGDYDIWVKHPKYLAKVVAGETLNSGSNTVIFTAALPAGDANNDNIVSALDFSILASTFNLSSGDAGYDDRADFNGDGQVSALDFSLLASNFNVSGETPLTAGLTLEVRDEPVISNADLMLNWSADRLGVGEEITATLAFSSGRQPVDAVQTILGYDPDVLEIVAVEWGDAFHLPLRLDRKDQEGRLILAAGSLQDFPAGEQVVATIRFRAKAAGEALLYFAKPYEGIGTEVTYGGRMINGVLYNDQLQIDPAPEQTMRVTAFPNPSDGRLTLRIDRPADPARSTVRIFSADGRMRFQQVFTGDVQQSIDLSGYGSGMYTLQVISGDAVHYTQLIIE